MNTDINLKEITQILKDQHGCHTVILYGSRARGDETPKSDYDLIGIKETGESYRDARKWNGFYLDLFIYSESKLTQPDESMLKVRDGVILCQKGDVGSRFLSQLEAIFQAGPKKLPPQEIEVLRVWAHKMLDRAEIDDSEGNFRRVWLLTALLEDYFLIQGMWYLGPKQSLNWLRSQQPALYLAYEAALKPHASFETIRHLVHEITKN